MIDSRFANRARRARIPRGTTSAILGSLGVLLIAFAGRPAPGTAEEISKAHMQSLDEQVQEVKSDVLGIAADLSLLEERLLFPSNTQIAVFVALAEGEDFRLDSLQLHIDGELVAHHIYAFKELEALQKGGVQRLYTGNVATGGHRMDVTIAGQLSGQDWSASRSFEVSKAVEPKLVELTLAGRNSDDAIRLGGL